MGGPPVPCAGVGGLPAAVELAQSGDSSLLVEAVVSSQPGPTAYHARLVPDASYKVLAGSETNGPVRSVQEAAVGSGANILPPGQYLLLLGVTSTASTYFLSDGLRGSFEVKGTSAYQRCPTAGDPTSVTPVHRGVTDISGLSSLFSRALKRVAH